MLNKDNIIIALLAGASAAAVAVLSIGGYFLHKKAVNRRLLAYTRRLAMHEKYSGKYDCYEDDYDDYGYEDDEDSDDDDYLGLFEDLDTDGFDNLVNEIKRRDNER